MSWWKRKSKSADSTESPAGEEAAETAHSTGAEEVLDGDSDAEGSPDATATDVNDALEESLDDSSAIALAPPNEPAPTEGAESWLLRRVDIEAPSEAYPGDNVRASLVLLPVEASELEAVPDDAAEWTAGPVQISYDASIDGAATASGTTFIGNFTLEGNTEQRVELPLMVACSLTGVTVGIRCNAGGYQVGRVAIRVPGRGNEEEEHSAGGILAIPDTVLS